MISRPYQCYPNEDYEFLLSWGGDIFDLHCQPLHPNTIILIYLKNLASIFLEDATFIDVKISLYNLRIGRFTELFDRN